MSIDHHEIAVPLTNPVLLRHFADPEGYEGWNFSAGDPEYWRFHDVLVKPGGKVLDIGIGLGRSSLYFAFNGMSVTGYDTNPENVEEVNQFVAELTPYLPCDMQAIHGDVKEAEIPNGEFDTAILAYMHHQPSKAAMFELADIALDSLKPGGALWFRAVGIHSSGYRDMLRASEYYPDEIAIVGDGVIEHPCQCSGEYKIEPSVFLDPSEVIGYFAGKNTHIYHTQTLPTYDRWNMMFGEDFRQDVHTEEGGMISVLAVKV